jgi:exodeoxyribonuclease VII large subunit
MEPQTKTLLQLQEALRDLVSACPGVQGVWVTAELSDVSEHGGHCYMELIQKDPNTGATVAKARGTIWANRWTGIKFKFLRETGQNFATGLQVMVKVVAGYHPVYGMNLNIVEVNSAYTMGDMQRRRREILMRLKGEGVLDMNRELDFPRPTLRIAVISAKNAAGYGDFMNQLYSNSLRLRFEVQLFESIMQGDRVPPTVMAALDRIAAEQDKWDCVVIIRGGGATSDLNGFEDYDLAACVAQFPLPIIVGIGHERDETVLDFVARQRVKTPTAAAEFLIDMAKNEVEQLRNISAAILQMATDNINGARQQLSYITGQLPVAPINALHRAEKRLDAATMALAGITSRRLQPMMSRLDRYADALKTITANVIQQRAAKLDAHAAMIAALSPQATLQRGYSITRVNGRVVTNASELHPGETLETSLASGKITSIIQ